MNAIFSCWCATFPIASARRKHYEKAMSDTV